MKRLAKGIAIGLAGLAFGAQALATPPKAPQPKGKPGQGSTAAVAADSQSASGAGSIASATARCRPGRRAVGGGFSAPSSAAVAAVVFESVKVKQRGWRVSAQLLDTGPASPLTLTAYAYCEKKAPKTKTRRATAETTGVVQLGPSAEARCRRSGKAVSGGFSTPPPLVGAGLTALVLDSHRSADGAWVTRVATGTNVPTRVVTEVYCAKRHRPGAERTATSPLNSSFFETSTATASCAPSAERTGGFAQPLSQVDSFLIVHESRRVDGGWRVSGLHFGSSPPVSVSALAYCG